MLNFIVSLFLGMIPEVAYFTLFLIFTKNLNCKRLKLLLLLAIGYVVLIMICRYKLLFYVAYIVYSYLVLKELYNSHISDIFTVSVASSYLTLISFTSFKLFDNYIISYIINRLLLFIPLILVGPNINKMYKKYLSLWNRHEKGPIKSITLRNISLVFVNIFIVLLNMLIMLAMFDYLQYID